ncbi:glycosyltransferase family 39 protein [Corallococcus sp. BB11-1]|uniref:ArnT family glycosyltransferase n=1 Tax=Corallococcus sp. BB11-1 TaxID=2996783 RepID=UPI0022706E97|nr:glycosyltransferase family 39 protein [Corallococcus sp. BB11-1]MCY1035073.1 glycosyltransferase family 39 protein [Corallococcus sp. BB11-1]
MRACVALVALGVGVRLALALGTDVYFDEAYYWQWARHLAWGYFDHPPLVAWLIAALGIRGTALLCGLGTGAAVWGLARDVYGSKDVAWRALALWSVVPVGIISGVWATPDSPMLLFWALGLWALYRERWVLAGLTCGLALLSKYPSVLLGLAFMLAALRARRLPAGAWLTAGLGLLCFLPVVLWNASHEWVGFAFQLNHGLGGSGGWRTFGEFLAGQLAMGGPLLFPLALVYAVRGPREQFLLRMAALVPLVFFGYAAARTRGEANWPAAAYLAACIGVAGMKHPWQRGTAWSGALISLAVASHLLFPVLTFERDVLLSRTHGWGPLERLARPEQLFAGMTPGRTAVYAPTYQMASQVAYFAGVETDTVGPARRKSQYDVWPPLELKPGQDVLWCSENGAPPPEELVQRFGSVEGPVELTGDFRGRRLHTFTVWRLKD